MRNSIIVKYATARLAKMLDFGCDNLRESTKSRLQYVPREQEAEIYGLFFVPEKKTKPP